MNHEAATWKDKGEMVGCGRTGHRGSGVCHHDSKRPPNATDLEPRHSSGADSSDASAQERSWDYKHRAECGCVLGDDLHQAFARAVAEGAFFLSVSMVGGDRLSCLDHFNRSAA